MVNSSADPHLGRVPDYLVSIGYRVNLAYVTPTLNEILEKAHQNIGRDYQHALFAYLDA